MNKTKKHFFTGKTFMYSFFSVCLLSVLMTSLCFADTTFNGKLSQFSSYDTNGDGIQEIDDLKLLSFEVNQGTIPQKAKLVLVLVEPRLLKVIPGSSLSPEDVSEVLKRFKGDLRAEGYFTRFIEAKVYDGNKHQDGRTILALRDFLKNIKATYTNFQGVILVGSFPEPMLGRRWLWKRTAGDNGITIGGTNFPKGTEYLRIVPEIVSQRADLVLADLNGKWENIYEEGPKNLVSIVAKPDAFTGTNWYQNNKLLDCSKYDQTTVSFQDFFWIKDDNYQVIPTNTNKIRLRIFTAQLHPEMNNSDKSLANPLARPDIFVSRINPLHIAVNPDPNFIDSNGKKYLAADGKPQTVESAGQINLSIKSFWKRDPKLERKILIDYFDRNHVYRIGGYSHLPFRTAAVGKDLSAAGMNKMLKKASPDFSSAVVKENASLVDYVNWLKESASYRGITAHSSAWNSNFGDNYAVGTLENSGGGKPWRWQKQGNSDLYKPSFEAQGGTADIYLHRTLWENRTLKNNGGRLYIHNGCEVNSPEGARSSPYNHEFYGTFQNAEGVLFYLNGVALCARAKVFYDTPRGFSEALGKTERSHFGNGWRGYYEEEAKDATLVPQVADNKRSYTWSILGDWTVRLRYSNGLGILQSNNSKLKDYAIHANNAWIGGWNYSSNLNKIEGTGDFNGDGRDDVLISSSWGIGILSHNGTSWEALVVKPKDTWFGSWRYNPKTTRIDGIGDFNGDGKDDILISSPWGIGIMKLQGASLTSINANAYNHSLGKWYLQKKT